MKKTILIAMVLVLGLVIEVSRADFVFGEPTNLGPVVNSGDSEGASCISADGRTLYFAKAAEGEDFDLFVATRETTVDEWSPPVTLGPLVNSPNTDIDPYISTDGLELFFRSNRPGGDINGRDDIWVAKRTSIDNEWAAPVNLGSSINTDNWETTPCLSQDGLTLYFTSGRYNEFHQWEATDLYVAHRETKNAPWEQSVNMGPVINDYSWEYYPTISPDNLVLLFASDRSAASGYNLWMASRLTVNSEWGLPTNLGPIINTESNESCPNISRNGKTLFFSSDRPGGYGDWDIWQAPIEPVVDLNGDGIVDAEDLCIVVDNWGTANQLCDVGPMPFGDGIVDVEDLIVIAEHLFEILPSADTVDVNEANDGGQVELEQGKLLVVTLESNPSTGYRWELIENNESVLEQIGQSEYKPAETSEPPIVGAGGWEIFRFKTVSTGQTTLEFVYRRPWEDAEPLKTFYIQVTVN